MVFADTGHGYVRRDGEACISSRSDRIPDRYCFLLFIDSMVPHLHVGSDAPEGHKSSLNRTAMLMLAVTIHNFPEGAACGAIFAGVLNGDGTVTMAGALTLAIGIAIQNFPEGAIISLPLRSEGNKRGKSFALGVLSGAVEPVGAILAIALASIVTPIYPICWLLQPEP